MWINNNSLTVGSLVAKPGKRVEDYITVGSMPDGTPVRLPVVLINGTCGKRTLYLQSISDGDELNGIAVVHELLRQISPDSLNGRIIAVPIVNFHAFHAKQACSPVDQMKMNRCFPENPEIVSWFASLYFCQIINISAEVSPTKTQPKLLYNSI